MPVTITPSGSNSYRKPTYESLSLSFSASTDEVGASMSSITASIALRNVVNNVDTISNGSGVSSCSITGQYTNIQFPNNSYKYVPKGKSDLNSPVTTVNNFNPDTAPTNTNIELLEVNPDSSTTKTTTITVTAIDSLGTTKTQTYTYTIEQNYGQYKDVIKRVYP